MSRFIRLAGLAALLLLFAAPADAQYFGRNKVQYDDFDFKILGTEQFDFYYYPEEKRAVTDAARMGQRSPMRALVRAPHAHLSARLPRENVHHLLRQRR
jgi:hypothetical protein